MSTPFHQTEAGRDFYSGPVLTPALIVSDPDEAIGYYTHHYPDSPDIQLLVETLRYLQDFKLVRK